MRVLEKLGLKREGLVPGGVVRPNLSETPSDTYIYVEREIEMHHPGPVKPNAKVSSLEQEPDGTWIAKLKAAPVDGKANAELVALVANRLGCRRSAVTIKSGAGGRMKLIRVEGA
jgi:uncharacterized protein YggU (UPF0235/DUF167 family)